MATEMRRRDVVAAATAASESARGILASVSAADGNESGMAAWRPTHSIARSGASDARSERVEVEWLRCHRARI
jgi:hypothetical protein